MKKMCTALLVIIFGFISCNEDGSPLLSFLNTENLPAQFYKININTDTVLRTKNGAEITIKKGAITAGNSTKVSLEVKEAYSMEDMVKAGLQTTSNGKPLSSGGMIYLNVKDEDARIVVPIKISMPSNNVEQKMQLFKGVTDNDGNIDWTAPEPLLPNKTFDTIAKGKAIFVSSCASCHHSTKESTGPPLAFITQRLDKEWLTSWIHNSAALIASGDPYANCIYERYNKTAMTLFPGLTDDELEMLYKFLENESKYLNPKNYPDYKAMFDSCKLYNDARALLIEKRGTLIIDNDKEVMSSIISGDTVGEPIKVAPKEDFSTYYQFNITAFGWYNIDAFSDNIEGYKQSKLSVKITGEHNQFTNIFLVIPSSKSFTAGGLLDGETDVYGFYTIDGSLNLPQGKEAYIMAFTEEADRITFGFTHFVTGLENKLVVKPQVISKDEMNQKIKELNFEDLAIEAKDSKNADSIRIIDVKLKDIESLKPKGADCNCGYETDTASIFKYEK